MKEMIYKADRDYILLDKGTYNGYNYMIVSYGTHPCCYIQLFEGHRFYGVRYDDIDLNVHGGLTFDGYFTGKSIDAFGITDKDYFIGWDYAHYSDYSGYLPTCGGQHKWTTEMLLDEMHEAIDELVELCSAKRSLNGGEWYRCTEDIELLPGVRYIIFVDGKMQFKDCPPYHSWEELVEKGAKIMLISEPSDE